jgi:beta-glucuronidase
MFPDKMLLISEFGLAGPFAPDTAQADALRVRIMEDQLREFARHDFIAGAIFWCYQDYKSHRNLWPGETTGFVEMGLVDENRQRLPSYSVWKERTSPARLSLSFTRTDDFYRPSGFKATVERRAPGELPSYELRDYRLEWEVRDHDAMLVASGVEEWPLIGEPRTVIGSWPTTRSRALTATLRLVRPTGFVAAELRERWWEGRSGGLSPEEARQKGLAAPAP